MWCRIHNEHHHGRTRKGACRDAMDDDRNMSTGLKFLKALEDRKIKSRRWGKYKEV